MQNIEYLTDRISNQGEWLFQFHLSTDIHVKLNNNTQLLFQ